MSHLTTGPRTRALVALGTLAALVTGAAAAAPASAVPVDTSITGTVSLPASYVGSSLTAVLAWEPDATGVDISGMGPVAPDGTFTITGLDPAEDYQLSVLDYSGQLSLGYYTPSKIVARASNATLVEPGTTDVAIPTKAAGPATSVRLVLPDDGTVPTWDFAGAVALEPGTGRIVTMLGGPGVASTGSTRLRGTDLGLGALASSAAPFDAVTAADNSMTLPAAGLLKGATYTVAVLTPSESDFLAHARYYGGEHRVVTQQRSKAATFTGGTARLDVHVLGARATKRPTVSGKAKVGAKLTATAGTWSVAGKVSYQWQRNGRDIAGATSRTYTLKAADAGRKVGVRTILTPKDAGYAWGWSYSDKPTVTK